MIRTAFGLALGIPATLLSLAAAAWVAWDSIQAGLFWDGGWLFVALILSVTTIIGLKVALFIGGGR